MKCLNCGFPMTLDATDYFCKVCETVKQRILDKLMDNLPPGVTQDMLDEYNDGWEFPEPEGGCPECGADSPDDKECRSCTAANEGIRARQRRRNKKRIKEVDTDDTIPF